MMRKMLVMLLLLGLICTFIIFFSRQSPETISVGSFEAFATIDVDIVEFKTTIIDSPDNKIHVKLQGHKINKDMLKIKEENNTFFIKEKQKKKKWNDYISLRSKPSITIQLPKTYSKNLIISSVDGEFDIKELMLEKVLLDISSGAATLKNVSILHAELSTKDGNISVDKSTIDNLFISSNAGDVLLKEGAGSSYKIETIDGQIKMTDAIEQENVSIKSNSGDIRIQYKKAPVSLLLKTETAGDTKIKLPNFKYETNLIGKGANTLSVESKNGSIFIE